MKFKYGDRVAVYGMTERTEYDMPAYEDRAKTILAPAFRRGDKGVVDGVGGYGDPNTELFIELDKGGWVTAHCKQVRRLKRIKKFKYPASGAV